MRRRLTALALATALLVGCKGQPLPPDKLDYAGHWSGSGIELVIGLDGGVAYERASGTGRVQITGPIQGFEGDDFVVGVMTIKTTFDVTVPPTQQQGTWTMTVDGVVLTRR